MSDLLEEELPPPVLCEEPTMALLQSLGIPTDEWQYYLGFMKRMVELYLTFTSETLQMEKDSLIAEYVYRGKDKTVLEQVQAVAEVCAGIVVSCTEVKACLEGNYTSWSKIWDYDFPDTLDYLLGVSITFGPQHLYMLYRDGNFNYRFVIIKIADASLVFASPSGSNYTPNYPYVGFASFFLSNTLVYAEGGGGCFSIFGKYIVVLKDGEATFEVWKDGVLQWTSPLASAAVLGATIYVDLGISWDGKYIIAVTDNYKLVCFEGS